MRPKLLNHPIQCRCGRVKGYVGRLEQANRGVCYCKDCQIYAHFLGADEILDEKGGTDIIQTLPSNVHLTDGLDALACVRLTQRGILRWYSSCCKTPIGNTPRSFKISYIGLSHNCLDNAGKSMEKSFGPVRVRVNTKSAKGNPKPESLGLIGTIFRVTSMLLKARIDGSYRRTCFFTADGAPIAVPSVLSHEALETLKQRIS